MSDFDASLWLRRPWEAGPVLAAGSGTSEGAFYSLRHQNETLGELQLAVGSDLEAAEKAAEKIWHSWERLGFKSRAERLRAVVALLLPRVPALAEVTALECGQKPGSIAQELEQSLIWLDRQLERLGQGLSQPLELPGPTGEANRLRLGGRGLWLLLADDSVPLASAMQAALLALFCGNTVLLLAPPEGCFAQVRWVQSCQEAGLEPALLQLLPLEPALQQRAVANCALAGVIEFGPEQRSQLLARTLAERSGALVAQLVAPDRPDDPLWASERLLLRLLCEQTLTANLTAVGGNAQLLSQNPVTEDAG